MVTIAVSEGFYWSGAEQCCGGGVGGWRDVCTAPVGGGGGGGGCVCVWDVGGST